MLKLQGITKVYKVASGDVNALKGIDLNFRKSEFVSILGPSGCGKTTTLNIIGGLDKYTNGDLIINGVSTKDYKDRQWDAYRNHSIGFVFQSYNLIPHQTVLGNVELALTIGGIDKGEKTRRAKEALDKVGLGQYYYKKPNQLSGGQCQRVAIARALVTEPEILLADEPTGALDSETSVQIMELIKEIAKERLVIMVTHNSELAEEYSTRIVKFKDGLVIDDSNPYDGKEKATKVKNEKIIEEVTKKKKTKMSFLTAFRLSLQNLLSKGKRTFMIAFAGAIGIIGVTSVLSVSNGMNRFIDNMQEEMLASSPITIAESSINFSAMMGGFNTSSILVFERTPGFVNINDSIAQLVRLGESMANLVEFNILDNNFVRFLNQMDVENTIINFDYGLDLTSNIFADFRVEENAEATRMSINAISHTQRLIIENLQPEILQPSFAVPLSYLFATEGSPFSQMIGSEDDIRQLYEFVDRREDGTIIPMSIPTRKDEILIVLDENNAISDITLAQLGILSQEDFVAIVEEALERDWDNTDEINATEIPIEDLMGLTFTFFDNHDVFGSNTGTAENPEFSIEHIEGAGRLEYGLELTVTGVVRLKESVSAGFMQSGFFLHPDLLEHALVENVNSPVALAALGLGGRMFTSNPGGHGLFYDIDVNFPDIVGPQTVHVGSASFIIGEDMSMSLGDFEMSARHLAGFHPFIPFPTQTPLEISIFNTLIADQDRVLEQLALWNNPDHDITLLDDNDVEFTLYGRNAQGEPARQEITYNNLLGMILSMMSTLMDLIFIALIAFTSLSLVVSSVMIGIITYVSVVERVKEIGVIRSLGGRKGDVSRLFTAETLIIGGTSGIFGVGVAWGLSGLINLITVNAGVGRIALLSSSAAIAMILLSIGLTVIAGLIPSRSAAKKDPVVALRSE